MKEIILTQGKVALVDDDDYDYLNQFNWCAQRKGNRHYATHRTLRIGYVLMHRFILKIIDSKIKIDHRDLNGLNNQRYNLRIATNSQNQVNQKKRESCSSEYKGVTFHKDRSKWTAQIMINYKNIHLGSFEFEHEAAIAYDIAAKQYFNEFAILNFP